MGDHIVVEWNQASGQPSLAFQELYGKAEAIERGRAAASHSRSVGRGESYSVHPIDLDEAVWEDGDDSPPQTMHAPRPTQEMES